MVPATFIYSWFSV